MYNLKLFLLSGLALLAVGCSNESLDSDNKSNQLTPVRVHVDGFKISQESFSRETRGEQKLADYDGINAVALAFYKADGTSAYKHEQLKRDSTTFTTFGDFSLSLPMGSYTMVVVAYTTKEESPFVLSSASEAAYTGSHAYDTFAYSKVVNISNKDSVDITATLDRIISQLKVVSTDGKAANASNVRMTFSAGGKDFNPSTGWAITNTGFANTVGISASTGANSTSLSVLFLAEDNQEIDVTIETLDADGNTLFSQKVEKVPFMRNRRTKLTGVMYTNSKIGGSFKVNTDWLDEEEINF